MLNLGLGLGSYAASGNPLALFGAGEKGGIWLPEYTDAAVDASVGTWTDISPNAKHATQATALNKPTLRRDANGLLYVEFDGSNDSLATAAIDMTGTDAVTVFVAMRKNSDAARGILLEFGPSASFTGAFNINAPGAVTNNIVWTAAGSSSVALTATGQNAGVPKVLTCQMEISPVTNNLRINGALNQTLPNSLGTGSLGNKVLYIGRRDGATLPYNGRIYGIVIVGRACTAAEILATETFMNRRILAF